MDPTSKKTIQALLKERGIKPFKGLGQNFLVSKTVLKKIIKAAELKKTDLVLEIGPGLGTLTQELAKRAKKVMAVEKDKRMVGLLKETLRGYENVEVICDDILKTGISSFKFQVSGFKIIANLPYYITAPVIKKFLETNKKPEEMVLMVQKEVAQRICAQPPRMTILTVSVQFYAKPKIISYVSRKNFWPAPKVDSAILKIVPFKEKRLVETNLFFKIVRTGFSHPRKQIVNNLFSGFTLSKRSESKGLAPKTLKRVKLDKESVRDWLLKNKIAPEQRAQDLSVEDWKRLTNSFNKNLLL